MRCIVYDDVLMYAHTALYHDVWRCMAVWDGALGGTMRVSCMERNTAKIQQIHSNFIQQILQQIIHQSPASTAAMHSNCFMIATGYPRLKPPCGRDAEANRAHNERSWPSLRCGCRSSPMRRQESRSSTRPGTAGYVSAVKSQLSQQARGSVLPERPMYLSRTLKGIRESRPPAPPRKARPALGAAQLRRIRMPVPRDS